MRIFNLFPVKLHSTMKLLMRKILLKLFNNAFTRANLQLHVLDSELYLSLMNSRMQKLHVGRFD